MQAGAYGNPPAAAVGKARVTIAADAVGAVPESTVTVPVLALDPAATVMVGLVPAPVPAVAVGGLLAMSETTSLLVAGSQL